MCKYVLGKTRYFLALPVFLIIFCLSNNNVVFAETMTLTMRADSQAGKLGSLLLREAYRRLGMEVEFLGYPGSRAIAEANRGASDGEVVRLKRVLKNYPNLRLVPEPLLVVTASVASKIRGIKVEGWESIKKYTATTVRGYKSIERRLEGQKKNFTNSVESALMMLERDRVEILVLSGLDLRIGLAKHDYKGISIIEPPISSVPLYHLLHKSREALVPEITATLKTMKADGTHQQIVDDFINR